METTPWIEPAGKYFIESCRTKLMDEYFSKVKASLAGLTTEDVWWRAHETNNSIGNLILHLTGNITQWVVASLGDKNFHRNRPQEFSEREHIPIPELLARLETALKEVDAVLASFPADELNKTYTIQKYDVTALEVILHVTEHFSYHLGQIVYITKLRTGNDLKFYNL